MNRITQRRNAGRKASTGKQTGRAARPRIAKADSDARRAWGLRMLTRHFELSRARILRVLDEGGARKRAVLDALTGDPAVLDSLLEDRLVLITPGTSKKGTTYET